MSDQLSEQTDQRTAPGLEGRFTPSRSRSALRGPVEPLDGHEDTDHLALLYEDRAEQFEAVVPFIRDGLERGERCVYVADDNTVDEVLDAMRARGVDVDAALESGGLSVYTEGDTYRRSGEFDREAMMEFWEETLADATADEFTGLRAAAEMTWALETDETGPEELCEYEELLNPLYDGDDYTVLCQYNRDRFPADVVHDVLKTHPYLVYDGTICQNLYYTPPAEYFGPDRVSREIDRKLETLVDRTDARVTIETSEHYQREVYEIMSDPNRAFDEKLDALFEIGCERFDLDLGGLARVDPERDLFEVEAVSGDHDHLRPGARLDLSETYCRVVADSDPEANDTVSDPVEITDPVDRGFEDAACFTEFGVDAYLGTRIPIEGDHDRTFFFVADEPRDASISEDERTFHRLMGQWVKYELERRQRERDLRKRTEHLNALIETTPECIKTVAPDGTLLQMNPAGLEMIEADAESDVIGECVYDLIAPADRERFREFNERICRGESGTLEFDIVGLDGTRRHMESHAEPLERPDGTTVQVALTRDITEQRERKRELDETITELRESKERLRLALEAGEMGTWELDLQSGDAPVRSPQHDRIFGYEEPVDDWSFETFLDHVHPDDRERVKQRFEEAFETGKWDFECWITGADGEQRAISGQGEFYHDGDGEPVRAVGVVKDVTGRKQAEEDLQKSKEQFRALVTASSDVVYRMSPDWNEMHELEGKDFLSDTTEPTSDWVEKYILPDDRQRVTDAIDEAIRTKSVFELEHRVEQDDGSIGWTHSRAVPMLDEAGEIDEWIGMASDITERKEHEQALRESKNQLRTLIELLPVAVFVAEGDGQIVEWNEAAEEIWGGEVAESESVAEYEAYDGWWADTGEPVAPDEWALARALRGEEVTDPDEIEIEGFDGERRTVLNHGMPVRNEDGEVSRAVVTLVDITERKEREAELRQTKDRFETVFEHSNEAIFINDPYEDEIVDANPAGLELLGYDRDELLSLGPSDCHPDEMEQFRAFVDGVFENGHGWTDELTCRTKTGEDVPVEISASPIKFGDRRLMLAIVRDITERKKHEQYQRDLYRITSTPDLSFDEKLERLLELGRDRFGLEMAGLNHLPSWDGEFRLEKGVGLDVDPDEELWADPSDDCYCRRTVTEDEPVAVADVRDTPWTEDAVYNEFGIASYLGTKVTSGSVPYGTLWFGSAEPCERPFSDAERSFIELMGQWVSYEIERREYNESQQELYEITADVDLSIDEKIDRLLEVGCARLNLPVGMLTCERTNAFEIEHMHGSHPDLDEGTLTPPLTDNYCRRVVDTGNSISVADAGAAGWDEDALYHEFDLQCYAGTQVIVDDDVYGTVCFTDTGPREEFTETERAFLDLLGQCIGYELERQQYERELEETVDRLQQSNERLEHFAYAASHDLQEPLRMVTSYLQLLEGRYSDAFDEDGEEFLEFAVDGADRMREMIDGLLAYSRVETRGDPFEPVDLDTLANEVLTDLQIEIEETDAEITTAELPRVEGDESQLRQLLQNLLDNALTYSGDEPPRIHIDAERRRREWVISVRDNGIGIEPDDQDRIFTVFDRLHSRDEYDGTGLGLALCQRIVERHDGEIWVESEPGEGSTFSFTLPAA